MDFNLDDVSNLSRTEEMFGSVAMQMGLTGETLTQFPIPTVECSVDAGDIAVRYCLPVHHSRLGNKLFASGIVKLLDSPSVFDNVENLFSLRLLND